MTRRILAIVVLYKMVAADSPSYTSLLRSAQGIAAEALDLRIVLHDNSPEASVPEELPRGVSYVHDASNSGLANAYNKALGEALEGGYEWLLTLDQDTELPLDALRVLLGVLDELEDRLDVGAIVPQIVACGRIVSPNYFAAGAWARWFNLGYRGIPKQTVYGFNSGSLVRTSALRQMGGYSPWFWLDNSDAWLYRQLSKFGKRVYVAGQLVLNHDFSMMNLQERVSPERYETILLAESAFWDLEMNGMAGLERTLRLAVRMVKHVVRDDDRALQRLTRQMLGIRLFTSRRFRIARWRRLTEARLGSALAQRPQACRPRVSVCLAAYRGERFIEAQLRSVLAQLEPEDEIVVVDDCSQDGTLERVRRVERELEGRRDAPRLLVVRHVANKGVVATFEDAIRCATGDVLFLCDEDDLWAADKVQKVLDVFAARPEIAVVSTGLRLIDERDEPVEDAELLKYRRFTPKLGPNLVHNQFQGSAMAFRSTLIRDILPFPTEKLFLHDAWIGARCALAGSGGGAAFLEEPLLLYRRHGTNYSNRLSRWKQIRLRLQLVGTLLRRFGRRL